MKNNILIISGSGFIGSHLAYELLKENNVTVLSKYNHKFFSDIPSAQYIKEDWKSVDYIKLLSRNNYHKVILLGWSDHPRSSNENLLKSFKDNVVVNMNIIDNIIKYSESDIYFSSSYGALPYIDKRYNEQSTSGYAAGKMAIENYLNTYSKIYSRNIVSLRISNPYGLYQDPMGSQGVIPIFINLALKKQIIQMFKGCELKKDYIHIKDASKQISHQLSKNNIDNFSISEIKSGFLLSAIDIVSHINIHIPLLDLIPEKYSNEVAHLSDAIRNSINKKDNSHVKIFSDTILKIKNWITDINN